MKFQSYLDRSNRAVRVFSRLRDFLQAKGESSVIPIEEYQKEFDSAEVCRLLARVLWSQCSREPEGVL